MTNPAGEIGQLREDELPVVRVIVPPDPNGRVFEDDLGPGDLVFDGMRPASSSSLSEVYSFSGDDAGAHR